MTSLLDTQYFLVDKDRRILELREVQRKLQRHQAVQLAAMQGELARMHRVQLETDQQRHKAMLRVQVLDAEIAALHANIAAVQQDLAAVRNEMAAVYGSKSWRYTAWLRTVLTMIRKLKNLKQLIRQHIKKHGGGTSGVLGMTRSLVAVVRTQGVAQTARIVSHRVAPPDVSRMPEFKGRRIQQVASLAIHAQDCAPRTELASVVVCVHNALNDVQNCLQSVLQWTVAPYELILVDDGSGEDTRAYLAEFAASQQLMLIRNDTAKGYTFAANQGLRAARGEVVVLLNSDTLVTPQWLERLCAAFQADPKAGLVGPLSNTASWQSVPLVSENGDWATNPLPKGWTPERYATEIAKQVRPEYPEMPFLNGFCMAVRKAVLADIGLFDEEHFGAGYGEENDYCLRARKAGWHLVLADHAYVFHAQSKSYSHERRKILGDRAGATLASLHGQAIIDQGVKYCLDDPVLEGIRARAGTIVCRAETVQQGQARHGGRRVLFLLPVLHAGGGANIVLSEAMAMKSMGVDVQILNLSRCRTEFERAYPKLSLPVVYVEDETALPQAARGFDVVVATANHTVEWMSALEGTGIRRAYYVQDYEPYFFPQGSREEKRARESYGLFSDLVRLTKTDWNRQILQDKQGVDAVVVGASYDIDLYQPRPQQPRAAEVVRILAMVRPSCERRGPVQTLQTLRDVRLRYGEGVSIEIMGADEGDLLATGAALDFEFNLWGRLSSSEVAALVSQCDLFLDFSAYQAMGLTAMEAMACGLAVVVPREGGACSFARDGVNALVIDTASAEARQQAVQRLIDDADLRRRLRLQALRDLPAFHPEGCALKILDALFKP